MLEAIRYRRGTLEILDQLLLPETSQYVAITKIEDAWKAINTMQVRGAPAIAIVGSLSVAVQLHKRVFGTKEELHSFVLESLNHLVDARPTAVNMKQARDQLVALSKKELERQDLPVEDMTLKIIAEAELIFSSDVTINRNIGYHGAAHMLNKCQSLEPLTVLTHCNTGSLATAGYGTALGVIRCLNEQNNLKHVYCTETRPYNQGSRLTAYELQHDKIPFNLVCDSMVAFLIQQKGISSIVVGADRVVANGDTANKIGTYQLAVIAQYHKIPFYVAAPINTIDLTMERGANIPIEERPSHEMTHIKGIPMAPEGIACWNPAFDVTPAELITGGIITEVGVCSPASEIKEFVLTNRNKPLQAIL